MTGLHPSLMEKHSAKAEQERALSTHTARRSRKEEVGWGRSVLCDSFRSKTSTHVTHECPNVSTIKYMSITEKPVARWLTH